MVIKFLRFEGVKKARELLRQVQVKNKLVIFGFSKKTVVFLSRDFYRFLNFLKAKSKEYNCGFIFTFYIFFADRKYLNALYIYGGEVKSIFGESFSQKRCEICFNGFNFLVLFYFELYDIKTKQRVDLNKCDLTIGIDNDEVCDNLVFLDNKFFNKLIFLGLNNSLKCLKAQNIVKKSENVSEYNVQKKIKLIK